jgi:hypothetical protein
MYKLALYYGLCAGVEEMRNSRKILAAKHEG